MMPSEINKIGNMDLLLGSINNDKLLKLFGTLSGWYPSGGSAVFGEDALKATVSDVFDVLEKRKIFENDGVQLRYLHNTIERLAGYVALDSEYLEEIKKTAVCMFSSLLAISTLSNLKLTESAEKAGSVFKKMKILNGLVCILLEFNKQREEEWLAPAISPRETLLSVNTLKLIASCISMVLSLDSADDSKLKTTLNLKNSMLRLYDIIDKNTENNVRYVTAKAQPYDYYVSFISTKSVVKDINNAIFIVLAEILNVTPPKDVSIDLSKRLISRFINICGFPNAINEMESIFGILDIVANAVPFSDAKLKFFQNEFKSMLKILTDDDVVKKQMLMKNLDDIEATLRIKWEDAVHGKD